MFIDVCSISTISSVLGSASPFTCCMLFLEFESISASICIAAMVPPSELLLDVFIFNGFELFDFEVDELMRMSVSGLHILVVLLAELVGLMLIGLVLSSCIPQPCIIPGSAMPEVGSSGGVVISFDFKT